MGRISKGPILCSEAESSLYQLLMVYSSLADARKLPLNTVNKNLTILDQSLSLLNLLPDHCLQQAREPRVRKTTSPQLRVSFLFIKILMILHVHQTTLIIKSCSAGLISFA